MFDCTIRIPRLVIFGLCSVTTFSLLISPWSEQARGAQSETVTAETKAPSPPSATRTIVFIGDSITDGYGVKKEEAYPEKIGEILNAAGKPVKIVNGGISGSVTFGADQRVRWFLKTKPEILVLALGANDALKGTPVAVIKKNLSLAIDEAQKNHVKVLLVGMQIFQNFGAVYTKEYAKLYSDLAKEKKTAYMPFLLEGVALDKTLMQSDAKHPNAKGQEIIAKNMSHDLEKLL